MAMRPDATSLEILSPERPVHILAVDDDPAAIPILEAAAAVAHFKFSATTEPHRCLELIRQLEPDVVLLDAMMPAIDGFELCRRIKRDENLRFVPVVLVTARKALGLPDAEELRQLGGGE